MNQIVKKLLLGFAVLALLGGTAVVILPRFKKTAPDTPTTQPIAIKPQTKVDFKIDKVELKKFSSPEEYKNYLSESRKSMAYGGGYALSAGLSQMAGTLGSASELGLEKAGVSAEIGLSSDLPLSVGSSLGLSAGLDYAGNYSTTNVQVEGIDEPDSVKTDGKYIYSQYIGAWTYDYYRYYPYSQNSGSVQIIGASPATDLKKIAKIPASGEFLIKDNIVIVFESQKIKAFDISDKNLPKELWTLNIQNYGTQVGARLADGKLYLALGQSSYYSYYGYGSSGADSGPCPFDIYAINGVTTSVACSDIYHPTKPAYSNNTYTVSVIDPANGSTVKKVSFVGSYGSIFYMAPGAIYLSYNNQVDELKFVYGFASANQDFVPAEVTSKLEKLLSYDISGPAKTIEMSLIMESWISRLSKDDRLKFQNEFQNRVNKYLDDHLRELASLSIVKIGLNDFDIKGIGTVPGLALNQFSFDEYRDTLRVAVTVGSGGTWGATSKSVNDVYVLDSSMNIAGSVKDLGKGERIYAVRFVGDKGYVVTFKQTDPFYVLSFADPKNPKLEGELKIPGFSNYLEPLSDRLILGIGRDNNKVKLSLFDVSDPKNPVEKDKYELNEYWSEALNNHHAFMKNSAKQIFFVPGSVGGYFFSFSGDKLTMVKAVSESNIKRALYIGDVFYLVGAEKISSWNSTSWDKLDELIITEPAPTTTPIIYNSIYNDYYGGREITQTVAQTRDAKRMSDLKQIQTALELYYTDENKYPSGTQIILGKPLASCLDSTGFAQATCKNPYMGRIPSDPLSGQNYFYTVSKDAKSYTVTAELEGSVNGLKGQVKLTPSGISNK